MRPADDGQCLQRGREPEDVDAEVRALLGQGDETGTVGGSLGGDEHDDGRRRGQAVDGLAVVLVEGAGLVDARPDLLTTARAGCTAGRHESLELGQQRRGAGEVVHEPRGPQWAVGRVDVREPLQPGPLVGGGATGEGGEHEVRRAVQPRELHHERPCDVVRRQPGAGDTDRAGTFERLHHGHRPDRGVLVGECFGAVPVVDAAGVPGGQRDGRPRRLRAGTEADLEEGGCARASGSTAAPSGRASRPSRRPGRATRPSAPRSLRRAGRRRQPLARIGERLLEPLAFVAPAPPGLDTLVDPRPDHDDRRERDEDQRVRLLRDEEQDRAEMIGAMIAIIGSRGFSPGTGISGSVNCRRGALARRGASG